MIVDKIRSNILTEGSITELVKAVDEEMDGIASEQRKRLKPESTEGGRRVSILKWSEGALLNLG